MKCKVTTLENKSAGDIDLSEDVFGLPARPDILHRMVNWQLAKRRSGNHKVKVLQGQAGGVGSRHPRHRHPVRNPA